jgi:hypothetical protein
MENVVDLKLNVVDDLTLEMVQKLSEFKRLKNLNLNFEGDFEIEAIRDFELVSNLPEIQSLSIK